MEEDGLDTTADFTDGGAALSRSHGSCTALEPQPTRGRIGQAAAAGRGGGPARVASSLGRNANEKERGGNRRVPNSCGVAPEPGSRPAAVVWEQQVLTATPFRVSVS